MTKMHERIPPLTLEQLERGRTKISKGYPKTRLVIPSGEWADMERFGEFVIPEGPWSVTNRPGISARSLHLVDPIYTIANPMSEASGKKWSQIGNVDTARRPMHPRAAQLLTTIGMYTQPGSHRHYGPNGIVNFGLRCMRNGIPHYAIVGVDRDEENLRYGMPGGYVEKTDASLRAAVVRETLQETGVDIATIGDLALRHTSAWPHPFWKNTLHAWTEEYYFFGMSLHDPQLSHLVLATQDPKEIKYLGLMSQEEINNNPYFLGAHRDEINANELYIASGNIPPAL